MAKLYSGGGDEVDLRPRLVGFGGRRRLGRVHRVRVQAGGGRPPELSKGAAVPDATPTLPSDSAGEFPARVTSSSDIVLNNDDLVSLDAVGGAAGDRYADMSPLDR